MRIFLFFFVPKIFLNVKSNFGSKNLEKDIEIHLKSTNSIHYFLEIFNSIFVVVKTTL